MSMYPFKSVMPICRENECPYCYFVKRVRSVLVHETYTLDEGIVKDLECGKVGANDINAQLVECFVRRGYSSESEMCRFVNCWMPTAHIVICPNCELTSFWAKDRETAESMFQMKANERIERDFAERVREIIRDSIG